MKTVPDKVRRQLDSGPTAKADYYQAIARTAVLVAMGEDIDYSWIDDEEMQMFTDLIDDVRDHTGGRT